MKKYGLFLVAALALGVSMGFASTASSADGCRMVGVDTDHDGVYDEWKYCCPFRGCIWV